MVNSLIERVGRRKAILVVLGSIWVLIGVSILLRAPMTPVSGVLFTYLPGWVRVLLWASSGTIALIAAAIPEKEPKPEAIGFAALYIMPAERAVSYFIGWIASFDFVPGVGYPPGLLSSFVYVGYMAIIYICSGWFEYHGPLDSPRRDVR